MSDLEYMGWFTAIMFAFYGVAWWASKRWPAQYPALQSETVMDEDIEDDDVIVAWHEIADIKAMMRNRKGPPTEKDGVDHQ